MNLLRSFVAVLLVVFPFAVPAADPVAFVSDVRGDVAMNDAGRPPFFAELLPGSKLVLGPGAGATVMFVVSGEEYLLAGPGEFVVGKEGVKARKGARPTTKVVAVRASAAVLVETSRTATASLRMRSVSPQAGARGGLLYPVGARIATLHPTLRWTGDANAVHSVVVTSASGAEIFRGSAKGSSLRLPVRLAAGQGYSWRCVVGEVSIGESRFETLPPEAIATAERARADARTFSERVQVALVLQDLGAEQDAREAWAQLASERPDIPELAGLAR